MLTIVDFLFGNPEGAIDKTAVWTAVLALVTLFLVLVAGFQLSSIKKTARADYLKRLNDSFFTEEMRCLLVLLFNQAIEFSLFKIMDKDCRHQIDELPYFKIKTFVLEQLKEGGLITLPRWRQGYNAFEIDDLLLGPLDDVGRFEKNGLLDIHTTFNTFGYYVCELVGDNVAVTQFLEDKDSQGNYDDLEYLFEELQSFRKVRNKCWCIKQIWCIGHWWRKLKANLTGVYEKSNGS